MSASIGSVPDARVRLPKLDVLTPRWTSHGAVGQQAGKRRSQAGQPDGCDFASTVHTSHPF